MHTQTEHVSVVWHVLAVFIYFCFSKLHIAFHCLQALYALHILLVSPLHLHFCVAVMAEVM